MHVMEGQICLITGATSGIGRETAFQLARLGAHVIIVARAEKKARQTTAWIRGETSAGKVDYLIADLSKQGDVRRLASTFKQSFDRLDVLINNAGDIFSKERITPDGLEHSWAVNHLSHFILTLELLDLMKSSAPSRIITVSSGLHARKGASIDEPAYDEPYNMMRAYSRSKLANVMFTYALARRLEGTGVTANCLHPGVTATGFGHNNGRLFKLLMTIGRPFMRPVAKGARTSVYLARSREVEGVTGKFFVDCQETASSEQSYDRALQERLWEMSVADTDPAL